jgi:hypothetical protein
MIIPELGTGNRLQHHFKMNMTDIFIVFMALTRMLVSIGDSDSGYVKTTATEKSARRTRKNQIIIRFMPNLGVPKFSKRARRIPVAVR